MSLLPFFNRRSLFTDPFDDFGLWDRPAVASVWDISPLSRATPSVANTRIEWVSTLRLPGFKPEEVKVERGDNNATVKIHARQGSGDEFSEMKKTIHVPDNVDREHVDVDFSREGVLVVRAPYKQAGGGVGGAQLATYDPFAGWPFGSLTDEMRTMRDNMLQIAEQSFPGSMFPTFVQADDGTTRLNMDFDLRGYKPEEITVTHQGDNVSVEARHEKENKDGTSSYKHFKQVFTLPKNVKADQLQSRLMQDGRLKLVAPCEFKEQPQEAITEGGKEIPVKRGEHQEKKQGGQQQQVQQPRQVQQQQQQQQQQQVKQ